jgi:hypothetical protein
VAATLMDELRIALAQSGAVDVAGAAKLARRHRNAWNPVEFAAGTSRRSGPPRLDANIEASNGGGAGNDAAAALRLSAPGAISVAEELKKMTAGDAICAKPSQ